MTGNFNQKTTDWCHAGSLHDIAIGAGGLEFYSRSPQIRQRVANGLLLLRRFFV